MDYIYLILLIITIISIYYILPKTAKRTENIKSGKSLNKQSRSNQFIPSPNFRGKIDNMVYKLDKLGLGYYRDTLVK